MQLSRGKLDQKALAQQLRLAVTRTARRMRQEAGGELTPSQAAALATIERRGPITPSELATCERISRPTATRVLGHLTEAGLVERTADPSDGRSSLVSATPSGRDRLRRMRRRKDAYLSERLRGLSQAELETLAAASAILERLHEDGERG